jgi:hypothetical protein
MKWNTLFATMLAVGTLTATAARAQEDAAKAAAASPSEAQAASSKPSDYGMDFGERTTVDAGGVPVAKPNPMSKFLDQSRQDRPGEVALPLLSDWRTAAPPTDGQAN